MEGQTIQNSDARKDTVELVNGQEVKAKERVKHDIVSKTFSLCALMSVDMFYTQFTISKSWGEVLCSVDNVVLNSDISPVNI